MKPALRLLLIIQWSREALWLFRHDQSFLAKYRGDFSSRRETIEALLTCEAVLGAWWRSHVARLSHFALYGFIVSLSNIVNHHSWLLLVLTARKVAHSSTFITPKRAKQIYKAPFANFQTNICRKPFLLLHSPLGELSKTSAQAAITDGNFAPSMTHECRVEIEVNSNWFHVAKINWVTKFVLRTLIATR